MAVRLPILLVRRTLSGPYRIAMIATDFSDPCRGALRMAARLAPQAWIQVLYALDPPYETKLVSAGPARCGCIVSPELYR